MKNETFMQEKKKTKKEVTIYYNKIFSHVNAFPTALLSITKNPDSGKL